MTSLPTIHTKLETLATELTKQDSELADDVLAARYDVQQAIESPRPADQTEHLENAHKTLELATKMNTISDLTLDQQDTLETLTNNIKAKQD